VPATRTPSRARAPALSLAIQGRERFEGLPARATLRRWVAAVLSAADAPADRPVQLTLRFVDAREGRRLNREFRGRDHPTNVLTFDYARSPLAADVVICVPVIRREAREQRKALRAHLVHLVVHGVLHAQGQDHRNAAEARRMEAREIDLLATLGYPDPYV
jgi:probable rRNA maturation factor